MKNFLKDFIRAVSIGLIIFLIIGFLNYETGFYRHDLTLLVWYLVYSEVYSIVLFFVNAYYFRFLLKTFPGATFKIRNLVIGGAGGVVVTIVAIFLIRFFIGTIIEGENVSEFIAGEKGSLYGGYLMISILITTIFYIIYYYKNVYERKITEHKIVAGTASAKFDALKNQLDPHFLFNSLNVLTSLIEENPEAATDFTTNLSKVYRYVLEQKSKTLVTVEEELRFAKLYMSLLATRFEDSLEFLFPDKLENPDAKVVPLALQLLLENAVKHNLLTPSKKLRISIFEKDGYLWVSNNLQPKQVIATSTGVGLENIRSRYEIISSETIQIAKTDSLFSVGIPMIQEKSNYINEKFIEENRYRDARKRVEQLKAFYFHLAIYLLAVPGFIYLNTISSPNFPWALFPIFGWGLGVASHAMEAFNYHPFLGKNWEEQKIRKIMTKTNEADRSRMSYTFARKRVRKLKDFYRSCLMAAIMLPLLAALNYYVDAWKNPWFLYAVFGWMIALIGQSLSLFSPLNAIGKRWEQRQLEKFLEEDETLDFKNDKS